ncbi:energy transducer TonB [Pseudoalteromonas sp. MMG006]|uniref:energy transducer TonB n=1 Tax=Pseudoalteromonas sp. MMG006 TaxID=2822683 RepID=UPI001B35F7BC|nr:energy transducer TonB [Pseudoalteromonas sp. MMG006]MBQ4798388.1 energy transducer TonB [Pseudoalteromonas sp. MMG006]
MHTFSSTNKTKNNRHPFFAFGLSLIVLSAALLLLWLGQMAEHHMQDKVVVREIAMVALPPPPPSVSQQQSSEPMQSLKVQGAGASIQAVNVKIKSNLSIVKPDTPSVKVNAPQWQSMSVNWDAFSLNQLDGLPNLLTPVKAVLPKSLTRQGVDVFTVKLDVFIDESGRVSLIEVVQNPYPELKPAIDKIIKQSRFSAPKKEGETVRARFIWPIEFKP